MSLPPVTPRPDLLDEEEKWSVDELRANQLSRLQETVRSCYENVPHYTKKMKELEVHPDDIKSLDDIRLLPTTDKNDLRDNYPFDLFAVPLDQVNRIHASSGTTGKPTVVGYTKEDIDTWAGMIARCIRYAGGQPGDMAHVAYGYGLFTGGLGAHYGAEKLGCTVVPMSGGQTEKQIQVILDFKPKLIFVTPSYFLSVLDAFEDYGVDPREMSLQIGLFGAEPWTEAMRKEIEQRGNMHATDIFGLSELMGPGVAQESVETKDGLTVWEDHFYPEILNPLTQEPVEDGQTGELVFTSLTKKAMPLLRYRTKDLTKLLPGTATPSHRRLEKITGRSDDLMIVRGVNVFPTQIEELILGIDGLTPHFQCILTRPDRMDVLTVRVEASPKAAADHHPTLSQQLQHLIKSVIGTSAKIEIVTEGMVERSVGKARRIIDQRNLT